MKIAVIGSNNLDSLEFNLKMGAENLGYEVKIFDFKALFPILKHKKIKSLLSNAMKISVKFNEYLFLKLADAVIDFKPDLVIGTWRNIHPFCIKRIKNQLKNSKVVHLNPDAVTTFGRQEIFMSNYDAYFTKCHYIERFMRNKLSLNVHYLPEAFNASYHLKPSISKAEAEKKTNIDVMMIGSLYRYRYKFIENLIKKGIDIKIFGNKVPYIKDKSLDNCFMNEYVTGARKAELFYGSKIVLNNFHYAEIESVNCKFFEIAGSGGVQLCDDTPAVHEFFEKDKEIFTFKNVDEATEKIKYLLKHQEIRYSASKKVYEKALEYHTYEKRIEEIIKTVFN